MYNAWVSPICGRMYAYGRGSFCFPNVPFFAIFTKTATTTSTYASSLPDHYPLNFIFWVRKACYVYEFSTLRLLVVVHIFEKINLGNIPMSHRKIIRVSDARQYPFQFRMEKGILSGNSAILGHAIFRFVPPLHVLL